MGDLCGWSPWDGVVEIAMKIVYVDNSELAEKMFRFRYDMYVQNLQWFKREDYPEGVVRDNFDDCSHNYVAINNQGGIEGSIRVTPDSPKGFMLERCHSLNGLRKGRHLAEFCRFVVSQRHYGRYLGPLLMKAGYQCVVQHGITHIVLSTRIGLKDYYEKLGFRQVGETYYDPMFPSHPVNVTMVLDCIAARNEWPYSRPRLYDFFTSPDNRIKHGSDERTYMVKYIAAKGQGDS